MKFKKGQIPWNKGEKTPPEIKDKLSKKIKEQYKKGRKNWNEGLTKENDIRVKKGVEKRIKTIHKEGTFAFENNPRWKGGKRAYKNLALKHYGNKCMVCGKKSNNPKMIHVHHLDHNRNNNKLENLKVLCAKCHRAKHPQKASEYQKKRASETHKGKSKSEETKIKMSEARKKWWEKNKG